LRPGPARIFSCTEKQKGRVRGRNAAVFSASRQREEEEVLWQRLDSLEAARDRGAAKEIEAPQRRSRSSATQVKCEE
jgi:hypothetical protein